MTEIDGTDGCSTGREHRRRASWLRALTGLTLFTALVTQPATGRPMGHPLILHETEVDLEITCSKPVMTTAPRFLSFPKGSAKYPFTSYCTSPTAPGAMTLRWEASWTPSETRADRPNASESITITSYEGFLPLREPGAKILLYWTGRCDRDPWLFPSTCDRLGSYVPPDIRNALRQIDHERFPLTRNAISPSLKKTLITQYQSANQPASQAPMARTNRPPNTQDMMAKPPQPQILLESPPVQSMAVQPQAQTAKPPVSTGALARSGIYSRDVVAATPDAPDRSVADTSLAEIAADVQPILEDGGDDIAEPAAIRLPRPLHITTARGEHVVIEPGDYEVGAIMDIHLGIAKEGQPTVLLDTLRDTHRIPIHQTVAVVIPGPSDDVHLLLLKPDGRRFDAVGSESGVQSRSIGTPQPLSDKAISEAVLAAEARTRSVRSPPCQPNPTSTGPHWIPVPCTMPAQPNEPSKP